ncbi:hypothetical protein DCAR_0102692 [Daucus carota subsp. sativus]|uniref:Uncharacterized protein n=1 Tax=Daucus carota subsp. sativus TaxID=79200 RepID=A0AAF0W7B9_DAUCS|nr:hypothetical protein DCAR_0102692 [Daucus carota subsp. sativus]
MVERSLSMREVRGSIPRISIVLFIQLLILSTSLSSWIVIKYYFSVFSILSCLLLNFIF